MVRAKLRLALATLLRRTGALSLWERQDANLSNVLRVLMYHRVNIPDARSDLSRNTLTVTPQQFAQQMHYVAKHYEVISVDRLLHLKSSGSPLPPRAVLITFDDASRDFSEYAWPVLESYGLPAIVFVPTAFPSDLDARFWEDRLYASIVHTKQQKLEIDELGEILLTTPELRYKALQRLGRHIHTLHPRHIDDLVTRVEQSLGTMIPTLRSTLNWNEIREFCATGLAVGNHTRHHTAVDKLSEDECRAEIVNAQADLKREIGHAHPVFCYPYGHVTSTAKEILRQEGFELGFTTINGLNYWPTAPLHLNRTGVRLDDSLDTFRMQLTVAYSRYKQAQRQIRRISRKAY